MQIAVQARTRHPLPDLRDRVERLQQKLLVASLALLQIFRPAHRPDTHAVARQGNHPDPAVREDVHADIACVLSRTAGNPAEVGEQRRALMLGMFASQAQLRAQKRITTRRIDQITRLEPCGASFALVRGGHHVPPELDVPHARTFQRPSAACAGMPEQKFVEFVAPHLEGIAVARVQGAGGNTP